MTAAPDGTKAGISDSGEPIVSTSTMQPKPNSYIDPKAMAQEAAHRATRQLNPKVLPMESIASWRSLPMPDLYI
jgi:hypothetical protein